jgi:hypothetical protein
VRKCETESRFLDIQRLLMLDMEKAITQRVRVLAGAFHLWRYKCTECQLTQRLQEDWDSHAQSHTEQMRLSFEEELARKQREQEDQHKKKADAQRLALVAQWAQGEDKGLKIEVLRLWRDTAKAGKKGKSTASAIKLSLMKWAEGDAKALLSSSLTAWHKEAMMNHHERLVLAMQEQEKNHTEDFKKQWEDLKRRHDKARKDLEWALAKSFRGDDAGLLIQAFIGWQDFKFIVKQAAKQRHAVAQSLIRFLTGSLKATLMSCWAGWRTAAGHAHELSRLNQEFQQQLEANLKYTDEVRSAAEQQLAVMQEKAAAGLKVAVSKWMGSSAKVLMKEFFHSWHKEAIKSSSADMKRKALQKSILQALAGETKGLQVSCFKEWSNYYLQVKERAKMKRGIMMAMFKSIEGAERAAVQGCFKSWLDFHRNEQAARELEAKHAQERTAWEERMLKAEAGQGDKDKFFVQIDAALRGFGGKGSSAQTSSIFSAWARYVVINKAAEAKRALVDRTMKSLYLGDEKELRMSTFNSWKSLAQNNAQVRLVSNKMHKNLGSCEQLAASMTNSGMLFSYWSAWKRDITLGHRERGDGLARRAAELEHELLYAYKQIDHLVETLQEELKNKEAMAADLEAAYAEQRKHGPLSPDGTGKSTRSQLASIRSPSATTATSTRSPGGQSAANTTLGRGGALPSRVGQSVGSRSRPERTVRSPSPARERTGEQPSPGPGGRTRRTPMPWKGASLLMPPPSCDWDEVVHKIQVDGLEPLAEYQRR